MSIQKFGQGSAEGGNEVIVIDEKIVIVSSGADYGSWLNGFVLPEDKKEEMYNLLVDKTYISSDFKDWCEKNLEHLKMT